MTATLPLRRVMPRLSICAAVVVVSAWFFNDALTYGLMPADAVLGRARACYTVLELWLGGLEPSSDIGLVQLATSAIVAIAASIYGVLPLKRKHAHGA